MRYLWIATIYDSEEKLFCRNIIEQFDAEVDKWESADEKARVTAIGFYERELNQLHQEGNQNPKIQTGLFKKISYP